MRVGIGVGITDFGLPGGVFDAADSSGAAVLLGSESSGLAIDFRDMSMVIKDTTTPANNYSGNPNGDLTYSSPATKWIKGPDGSWSSGTTLRTEYDGNGVALGVRLEPAATNLFLNSRSPATQNISVTAQAYTLSLNGTGQIALSGASTAGPLVGTGANDRVSLTFTPTAGTLTLTVSGSVDFVQLETGSVATSPIVTAGAAASRAADLVTLATSAMPYGAAEGTLYVLFQKTVVDSFVATLGDGTSAERVGLYIPATTDLRWWVRDNSTSVATISSGALSNGRCAAAGRYKLNDIQAAFNGTLGTADTTATIPTPTTLYLGGSSAAGATLNSHIAALLYLPRAMSDVELQAITTI